MAIDRTPDDMSAARREMQQKAAAEAERANAADQEARHNAAAAADANADSAHLRPDAAVDHAAAQAATRNSAEDEALRTSILAQRAEAQASIAAAERNYVDREVGEERRRASTYTFGFALTLAVLLAALVVGAIYMLSRPRTADQVVVNAGTLPSGKSTVVLQQPAASPATTFQTPPASPLPTTPPGGAIAAQEPSSAAVRPSGTQMQRIVVTPRAPYAAVFTTDPATMVGKRVTFDVVNVESVIADRAFWVGPSIGERMLAVLDRGLDEGVMERMVRVKEGQKRTMSGTIQRLPPLDEAKRRWKLDDGDVFDIQGQKYYVLIDRIDLR